MIPVSFVYLTAADLLETSPDFYTSPGRMVDKRAYRIVRGGDR